MTEERLLLDLADASDRLVVGGKAHNLHLAAQSGLPVPLTSVVTVAAWRQFLSQAERIVLSESRDMSDCDDLARAARREARTLLASGLPEPTRVLVGQLFTGRFQDIRVAVRSSGITEDSQPASFAGQFESVLNVVSGLEAEKAILRCWLSGLSEQVIDYQLRVGLGGLPMPMGVLIQRMVDSDRGGVLFSRDPISGNPDEVWISSNLGLGTTVVDGSVVPDSYILDRASGTPLTCDIRTKTHREDGSQGGGLIRSSVDTEQQSVPSLDRAALRQIWQLGVRAEEVFGVAIDLEWALADGKVYLLQVRPITR